MHCVSLERPRLPPREQAVRERRDERDRTRPVEELGRRDTPGLGFGLRLTLGLGLG